MVQLFWKDPGGILLRCLDQSEIGGVTSESHEGACGGYKYWKTTGIYVENTNTKSSLFLSSSKINQYYFIILTIILLF